MSFQHVQQPKSQNSKTSLSPSPFTSRLSSSQDPKSPPTQEEIENQAFDQDKFEATGLQLKQKYGSITSVEQERLDVLRTQMDNFWAKRMERVSQYDYNFASIPANSPGVLASATPIQTKLSIGQPNDQYEQEADRLANRVVDISNRHPEADFLNRDYQTYQMKQQNLEQGKLQTKSVQKNVSGYSTVPPIVHEALRLPGQPIAPHTRAFMENQFGSDFSLVRVHTDSLAAKSALTLNALAYTVGNDVVFAAGQYLPESTAGLRLLSHELVHVQQQCRSLHPVLMRQQAGTRQREPQRRRVFVIGSPGPGEIRANHPYQFAQAAVAAGGIGEGCLWIVERTGYEAGGVDIGGIQRMAGVGTEVRWLRPNDDVISIINSLPHGSIIELSVFSHGLPGNVTLRYGLENRGLPNYGISLEQVRGARPDAFAPNARIRFDSCNTGTSDFVNPEGNLAQQFAQQTGRDVQAWTGRTSYTEVNEPGGRDDVVASEQVRRRRPDFTEILSQQGLGRVPRLRTFSPSRGSRVGGFSSHFEISLRLPQSRSFHVPQGGSVIIRCPDPELVWPEGEEVPNPIQIDRPETGTVIESSKSFQERMELISGSIRVLLHRRGLIFDDTLDTYTFPVQPNNINAVYSNLSEGDYYVEIYRAGGRNDIPLRSTIEVDVYSNR